MPKLAKIDLRPWPDDSFPPRLAQAFAPTHKRALGIAVGMTFGTLVALITAFHVVARPPDGLALVLLAQYFHGYTISWQGVAIGFFWAFLSGFVAGWFAAFVRNVTLAVWLLLVKAKAQLSNPFLDHI